MPVERVVDRSGEGMWLLRFEDYFSCPDFTNEQLSGVKDTELRHDDVIICSYPKSGSHWFWEIVRLVLHGTADLNHSDKLDTFMERSLPARKTSLPSPRIFNTHVYRRHLPATLTEKKVKVIFVVRNPKDVCVSFYHHHRKLKEYEYQGTFDGHLHRFLDGLVDYGSVFAYVKDMEKWMEENPTHPVLVCHYENMKQNFVHEIQRLGEFLGKPVSEELAKKAEERCHIDVMKSHSDVKLRDDAGDPIIFRKGEVGDWKTHFTVAQNEAFDDVTHKETRELKTKFIFSL